MRSDFTKPGLYSTRTGTKAEVLATRRNQIFGLLYYPNEILVACAWHMDGRMSRGSDLSTDLVGVWEEPETAEESPAVVTEPAEEKPARPARRARSAQVMEYS